MIENNSEIRSGSNPADNSEASKEISDIEKEKLGQLNLGLRGDYDDEFSHKEDLKNAEAGEMSDLEKQQAKADFKKQLAQEQQNPPKNDKWPDVPPFAA